MNANEYLQRFNEVCELVEGAFESGELQKRMVEELGGGDEGNDIGDAGDWVDLLWDTCVLKEPEGGAKDLTDLFEGHRGYTAQQAREVVAKVVGVEVSWIDDVVSEVCHGEE